MHSSLATELNRLKYLLREHAFEKREVTLASGQKSPFYLDCKQVSFRGEGHALIGALFFDLMNQVELEHSQKYMACSGMALGAVPLASALAYRAFLAGRELPVLAVRPEAKSHGTSAKIEGAKAVPFSSRVIVVEDVITTGGSTLRACAQLREQGYQVDTVLALVDREAGGKQNLHENNLQLVSLCNLGDFL